MLHRAGNASDGFFVDIPFKPFPVSWQDTGSGVFTLAVASLFLGVALRREPRPASSAWRLLCGDLTWRSLFVELRAVAEELPPFGLASV